LRQPVQNKAQRLGVNFGIALVSALILRSVFYPLVFRISWWVEGKKAGLLPFLGWYGPLGFITGLLLLDWSLYVWHRLNHRVPFLWRFHNVHHIDRDLDVSTGLRFHFGELIFSSVFRSLQILLFGIPVATLLIFETLVTLLVLFQHSNIRLPEKLEQVLLYLIPTPRMHAIHHSQVRTETDSNYSTVLNVWDRLHRSLNLDVPQSRIRIGVPSYTPAEARLWPSLWMPFKRQRPWNAGSRTFG